MLRIFTSILCFLVFVTIVSNNAYAKAKKVNVADGSILFNSCILSIDTKKNKRDSITRESWGDQCCSKAEGYCIECLAGKNYCTKYPYLTRLNILKAPKDEVLAPTKDKPQFPSSMGNTLRPPATNAPTKDKPRPPPVKGTILMAPVTNAPTANIPKKRLFFKQFKKLKK